MYSLSQSPEVEPAPLQKEDVQARPRKAKTKRKGSIADSWAVLRSSPKILNLALLVVSYGVSHRLFEFAWKGQLGVLYPSAQQYQVSHWHASPDRGDLPQYPHTTAQEQTLEVSKRTRGHGSLHSERTRNQNAEKEAYLLM